MQRFAFLGAVMALLFGGAVVLAAASPSPSPSASSTAHPSASPTAHPSATPAPKATPVPKATPAPSSNTEQTFSSTVQPLQIAGTARVTETASGGGTVVLRVSGLLDAVHWTVDIDGGTIARPNEAREIAFKSGVDLTRLAMDTVSIHLTRAEMTAFLNAEKSGGVVAVVSDGVRIGYAQFGSA
jgi:hypothetical protein